MSIHILSNHMYDTLTFNHPLLLFNADVVSVRGNRAKSSITRRRGTVDASGEVPNHGNYNHDLDTFCMYFIRPLCMI